MKLELNSNEVAILKRCMELGIEEMTKQAKEIVEDVPVLANYYQLHWKIIELHTKIW